MKEETKKEIIESIIALLKEKELSVEEAQNVLMDANFELPKRSKIIGDGLINSNNNK